MKEMRMLLWKDIRLSELCLFAGIMLFIFPYMFLLYPYIRGIDGYDFNQAWQISTMLSQLAIAILAGNIIVCERADHSASFLAFQGVTRRKIITSKLISCTLVFVAICAISALMSVWLKYSGPGKYEDPRDAQALFYAIGFCLFGSCWLYSCFMPSPISAIVFGVLSPFFIALALSLYRYYFNPSPRGLEHYWLALNIMVGLISLVAGTWYFLRSKES
jgi:ABC-type transport system involved in multi-copper enzyme maturation permease subunit